MFTQIYRRIGSRIYPRIASTFSIVFLGMCLISFTSMAAECPLTSSPATPMPAWINTPGGEDSQTMFAVGVASATGLSLQEAISAAKLAANTDLARSIKVNISSSLQQSSSKITNGNQSTVSSIFTAVTNSATNLTLRSVINDAQWLDVKSCQVWVRMVVSKAEASRSQHLEISTQFVTEFNNQMTLAEDNRQSVPNRRTALATAEALSPLIDRELVPTFSLDVATMRVGIAKTELARATQRYDSYINLLREHLQSYASLSGETSAVKKKILSAAALRPLQEMNALAPNGIAGIPITFNLNERATELFTEIGAPCMASSWSKAQNPADTCSAEQLSAEKRRLYLIGRPVSISCVLNLEGSDKVWAKACALIKELFVNEGAIVDITSPANKAMMVKVLVSSHGIMHKQLDQEEGIQKFSFQGNIKTNVDGPDGINLEDSYDATGGWAPLSAQMASDILAINVVRRMNIKLTKLWEN